MTFFTEHSTLIIIMLLVIAVGMFIILLKVGYSYGKEMRRQDAIYEKALEDYEEKEFHGEDYWG